MMKRAIFCLVALLANSAAAQEAPPQSTLIARPVAGMASVPLPDASTYPRDIERGGAIFSFVSPSVEQRVFAAADPAMPLAAHQIDGVGEVYCAAWSLTVDVGKPTGAACFADADGDGAADTAYPVSEARQGGLLLDPAVALPAPQAWTATASQPIDMALLYGGPSGGMVGDDGVLRDGVVELIVVRRGQGAEEWTKASPTQRAILIPCTDDGRCLPYPAPRGMFALSRPTVDGRVHVAWLDGADATAYIASVRPGIEAMLARERQRQAPPVPSAP
jgi:hypothetical protein